MAVGSTWFLTSTTAVTIRVRPLDTLLQSLPVWLVCRGAGLTVRLQGASHDCGSSTLERAHLPPECEVDGMGVSQLMAVLESVHERWPEAGIWPSIAVARAKTRDACAGIVALCMGSSLFRLSLPDAVLCVDAVLCDDVNAAVRHEAEAAFASCRAVTSVAAMAHLIGVRGLLSASTMERVRALLAGEAAQTWFGQVSVLQRLPHFQDLRRVYRDAAKGPT